MPPSSEPSGSVRSAAEINERIRDLWLCAGGRLTAAERAEYEQLLVRWAAAVRAEFVAAA